MTVRLNLKNESKNTTILNFNAKLYMTTLVGGAS